MDFVEVTGLILLAIYLLRQRSQSPRPVPASCQVYQTVDHKKEIHDLNTLKSLMEYSQIHLESMSTSDLTFFLYHCTKQVNHNSNLFENPPYVAVVRSLHEKLQVNVDISANQMANIFWGMVRCGIAKHEGEHRDLIMFWADFVISHVDSFEMKHLANMLWSFANIYRSSMHKCMSSNEMLLFRFCDEEVSIRLTELFTVVSKVCQSKIMNGEYCFRDLIDISSSLAIASNAMVNGCDSLQPYQTLLQLTFDKCMNMSVYQSRDISNIASTFTRLGIMSLKEKELLVTKMSQQAIKMSISSFKKEELMNLLWSFNELDICISEVPNLFKKVIDQGIKLKFKPRSKFVNLH